MTINKIYNTKTTVLQVDLLNENYFKIKVEVGKKVFDKARPGHFAHVLCSDEIAKHKNRKYDDYDEFKNYVRSNAEQLKQSFLLLRRPLCIHNAYRERDGRKYKYIFDFLVRKKRKGTTVLSKLLKGDTLLMLAPVGNAFSYEKSVTNKRNVIVVAGGMGIAPVFFLCKKLNEADIYPTIFFGYEEDFYLTPGNSIGDDLKSLSKSFAIASNSIVEKGCEKGFVTDILIKRLDKMSDSKLDKTDIYACGPHLMLKKVAKIADDYGVNCEMSLEERMACGIGACVACVCKTKKDSDFKYKRVCVDGPVFNTKELIFE